MLLEGTREYEAVILYLEDGAVRRFETPVNAHTFMAAMLGAQKLLHSRHPAADPYKVELVDVDLKKRTVPRLVISDRSKPPTKPLQNN